MKRGRKPVLHQSIDGVEHKWCSGCSTWKPISEYGKNGDAWDGLRFRCTPCVVAQDRTYDARRAAAGIVGKSVIPPGTLYVRIAVIGGRRVRAKLYDIWDGMKTRCHTPSNGSYYHYGARGIRVCDEWRRSYDSFRAWAIAHGFRKGMTLDRYPNQNGNYEPANCRWATREEQTYNSSRCHSLTLNGVTKILPIWAKELGFTPDLLRSRRSAGWSDEQILTTPARARRH